MLKQIEQSIIAFVLLVTLAGCVTTIDPALPYEQLDIITLATQANFAASSSHPTNFLPLDPVPSGAQVRLLAADTNAAWFLVEYQNKLGWIPSFFSQMGTGRVEPPLIIKPLDGSCTQYAGATFAPDEVWTNSTPGAVIVEGSILLSATESDTYTTTLQAKITGDGVVIASDYLHLPLTTSSNLVLFAFALQDVAQGTQIAFTSAGLEGQSDAFQATYFSDNCDEDRSLSGDTEWSTLAVGQLKTELPTETATTVATPSGDVPIDPRAGTPAVGTPEPTRRPGITVSPTPTATPIHVTNETPPTRAEIKELVDRWDRIHHEADRTLDPTDLPLVLTGGALRQQEETLRNLRAYKCYWIFTDLAPSEITGWQEISVNEVIVTMRKHWDGRAFCNGKPDAASFDEPFFVRYQIVRNAQGAWRIAEKVPLEEAVEIVAPVPATPTPVPAIPTPVPQNNSDNSEQLYDQLLTQSRASNVTLNYRYEAELFARTLTHLIDEFRLPGEGITQQTMTNLLYRTDSGDRLNGLIQEVWQDWRKVAVAKQLDPHFADPQSHGLSPYRLLIIRMIQGTQARLSANEQRALYSYFSRSEDPGVWYYDVKGVIGAINRENF